MNNFYMSENLLSLRLDLETMVSPNIDIKQIKADFLNQISDSITYIKCF